MIPNQQQQQQQPQQQMLPNQAPMTVPIGGQAAATAAAFRFESNTVRRRLGFDHK